MSDSGEMARVCEAVERIDAAVERMVDCVLAPRVGLSSRVEVLEERARVAAELRLKDETERAKSAELDAEVRFTHKVARWIGIVFGGAMLLSLANLVISILRAAK